MPKNARIKRIKPVLKWAGGKTQLLDDLIPRMPEKYERYIEPFFGGGALFFAVRPSSAIIADSNPELINMYKQIAENADGVIGRLDEYKNEKEMFYAVREQDWRKLSKAEAAARTIYLNRTCFNGLPRKQAGKFNTPFGGYKRPNICDAPTLRAASEALRNAQIICGDYRDVLRENGRRVISFSWIRHIFPLLHPATSNGIPRSSSTRKTIATCRDYKGTRKREDARSY